MLTTKNRVFGNIYMYRWLQLGLCKSAILVLSNLLLWPVSAASLVHPVEVTASALNVRSGPGSSNAVLGLIKKHQIYISTDTQGAWHKLWYSNKVGWVHGNYVVDVFNEFSTVSARTLNIRSGSGTQYSIVGTAPRGSKWAIIDTVGPWKKIYYAGAERWAHGNYLKGVDPDNPDGLPTSSVGFVQLPASGPGFVRMSPAAESWGSPALVYGLMSAGHDLDREHREWGSMALRDISLENGGRMPGHASHRRGVDVDIRLLRNDSKPWGTTIYSNKYSQARNRDLITNYLNTNIDIKVMFFNDSAIFSRIPRDVSNRRNECTAISPSDKSLSYVMCWPNHHNHLHLRMRQ